MNGKNKSALRAGSAVLAVCFLSLSFAPGARAQEELDLDSFTEIEAGYGAEVNVTVGGAQKVVVEGYDRERFLIDVKGDTLVIKARKRFNWKSGDDNLKLTVTMAALDSIEVSTGASIEAEGIDSEEFEAEISTGGYASLKGRCGSLEIEASTGSSADARALECENVKAEASTGATMDVFASKSIRASASLGGNIDVHGNPEQRRASTSFGGNVDY